MADKWTEKKNAKYFSALAYDNLGFTLIEILVAISILLVLVGILMQGFANYAARQTFNTTVVDVRDGVITAREKTLASVNDTIYGVHVSSTAVVFFDGPVFVEGAAGNDTIALPSSVIATPSFTKSMQTATFTRLLGTPSATGTIVLADSTIGSTATVTISATGLVE